MASHSDVERLRSLTAEMDSPDEALSRLESEFHFVIPAVLRDEWFRVLAGGPNPFGFLTAESMRRTVFDIAEAIHLDAARLGLSEPNAALHLVPFAKGYGDRDYLALDLTILAGEDFGVRMCLHEASTPGPVYSSSEEWLHFEHAVHEAARAIDTMWNDPATRNALRAHVRDAEFDAFADIARGALEASEYEFDDAIVEEAIERAWEHADPVVLKPSLPPL